jgi:hypothetical protein
MCLEGGEPPCEAYADKERQDGEKTRPGIDPLQDAGTAGGFFAEKGG